MSASYRQAGGMRGQLYSIGAILASMAIFIIGNGLVGLLIPARAHLAGFSNFAIGLVGSAYFAGFVAGCFAGPRLQSRTGHIRLFAIGAGVAAASTLIQSMFLSELVWCLTRAVFGFAAANIYMVIESWLNDRSTNQTRGRVFSAYLIVNFSSLVAGQMLFATARAESPALFSLCAIIYSLCLIPVCLTRLEQPHSTRVPLLKPLQLYREAPVGLVGCIAVGLANGAFWTLAPVYALSHGFSKGWLSIFMSLFTLGGAFIQLPLGRFSDRIDRRVIIFGICVISALIAIAIRFSDQASRLPILLLGTMFGMSALPFYGLSVAHTNDRIPREEFVGASATLLMVSSLASVVGPPLAAAVIGWAGPSALFLYTAAVHGSMALYVLFRLRVRAEARTHHERFEPLLEQASPAAAALDPRSGES
ncbi:MAG: MFS transporter [Alphaproteobacteria bacterium]|nr:MFS transporter [Alphaproteobacteria bacterium]